MRSEWIKTTLEELSSSISYGYTESASQNKIGPHFLRITDIQNGVVDWNSVPYCPISEKDHLKYKLNDGDIVVARTGNSTGENYLFEGDHDAVFASYLIRFCIDHSLAHPKYVWYSMRSQNWWAFINGSKTGSAQAGANAKVLGQFPVKLPPIPEQKAIAHILGSLDDKIELNRKMNATLEAMAQALFKSWFVDFDPVIDNALAAGNPIPDELADRAEVRRQAIADGTANREAAKHFPANFQQTESMGWIPEGWAAATLGEYLEIKRGGSPRPIHDFLCPEGLPWVKIADATASPSRFLFSTKEYIRPEGIKKTVLMKKGSLILSNSATPGLPIFLELDACIHDGWLHFPKKKHFGNLYLYQLFLVIREELVAQGNGSVFTNLKTDILRAQRIVVPPTSLLQIFEDWMMPNFEKIRSVNVGARSLSEFRDTLLPKLISGELRIPEAENLIQEALT